MREGTINIRLMQDDSEVVPYETPGIPIYLRSGWLSMYANHRSLCHWHEDIELVRIHAGRMRYWVNGKILLLNEGDCLVINTRQMHYGFDCRGENCDFTCLLLHPGLFPANAALRARFVDPLLQNPAFECLHYPASGAETAPVRALLDQMLALRQGGGAAYPLQIAGALALLWGELARHPLFSAAPPAGSQDPDTVTRQNMLAYIYQHYPDKLGLTDIAAAGHVCRNTCCRIFREQLHQSPIDFLNHYRLEVSRSLLETTDESVLRIAQACGFNHPSYYAKLFYRVCHCTPTAYRRGEKDSAQNPR